VAYVSQLRPSQRAPETLSSAAVVQSVLNLLGRISDRISFRFQGSYVAERFQWAMPWRTLAFLCISKKVYDFHELQRDI
jgi:hypothetical protein